MKNKKPEEKMKLVKVGSVWAIDDCQLVITDITTEGCVDYAHYRYLDDDDCGYREASEFKWLFDYVRGEL